MRVLFTTWAWPSHLYALVPLAWACRSAGHEVLVVSQPELLPLIERTGLPGAAVGKDVDGVGMVRGYVLPSEDDPTADRRAPRAGKGPRALRMFTAHADSMVAGTAETARRWRADVVVSEPTALAGPLAAAAAGIPAVRLLYGADLMARARPLLPEALAPLAERVGVDPAGYDPFGAVTIDPCPPGFQAPDPAGHPRLPMRYVPFNGPGTPPDPPLPPPAPGIRRAVVTWGHTMARLDPALFLAGHAARALAALPGTETVLAVTAAQRPLLGEVPDGVRVVTDAPLHTVLAGADLVVAHGGAGTVLTGLRAGLPLLLVPQLPDHAGHAARVLAAGAGEVLTRDEAGAEGLRDAAAGLLDPVRGAERRAAARALRDGMLAQPAPASLVGELEERVVACAA
ncbi:nucleotide disphospho-sugar-binding domain-containing protein [Streptomyces sp. NPDC007025]|uniref:nucleotide disphospho-sugar-binding domain-containing protein n=1 Tax=Streptomyces sp. NPDC007025 TaxID=3364771 RepID=UPI0036C1B816